MTVPPDHPDISPAAVRTTTPAGARLATTPAATTPAASRPASSAPAGQDLLLPCDGGPPGTPGWRRVPDPAPPEILVEGGILVLDDAAGDLRYQFVAD